MVSAFAQSSDLPTTRPLKIGDNNKLDVKTSNQGSLLRMPSVLDEDLTSKNENSGVKMLPDRELVQAGHDLVIDPKVVEKKEKGAKEHFGDQYLGDFKTTAKFVGIVARDHEYVDGDRIKIYVNGELQTLTNVGGSGLNLPAQGASWSNVGVNSETMQVGRASYSGSHYFDGYISTNLRCL